MYKISRLKNGIRVVTEYIDYVKSVSVGVWIGAGSAMEQKENNGISHYIEHMLFKGTSNRSAKKIAEDMDSVGGQLNALTSKEYTCYYAKTLTNHKNLAFDILSDMIINSTFTEENLKTEKDVIKEEINMCIDTPEDFVHDVLSDILWQGKPLGYPIAGTEETLNSITRADVLSFKDNFYSGENMVISVVGNFDEDDVLSELEKRFGDIPSKVKVPYTQNKIEVKKGIKIIKKDIQQCHLCMGFEGLSRGDKNLYDLFVINSIFGGNMSSRLFQKVREEQGLAYSIYSYTNTYIKNGSLVVCAGLSPEKLLKSIDTINKEIDILRREKISKSEIEVLKEQLKASLAMGIESISSRMSSYGKSLLLENKVKTIEETEKQIDAVNQDSVSCAIDKIFDKERLNIAILGKVENTEDQIKNAFNF